MVIQNPIFITIYFFLVSLFGIIYYYMKILIKFIQLITFILGIDNKHLKKIEKRTLFIEIIPNYSYSIYT